MELKGKTMEKNLPVPYKSQWDQDAHGTANDCGPTSIAMILNYYGENLTTDQVYKATAAGSGLINIGQMQKAIASYGYTSQFKQNVSVEELKSYLDKNIPVVALVHYGSLNSVQDKNYKSGHFFTVVGYREDGYFVNDPNFKNQFRQDGDHHFFTKEEFEKAWADCVIDKNPVNSLIIIPRKEQPAVPIAVTPMTRNVIVVADKGLNVRSNPIASGKNIMRILTKDTSIQVDGYVIGEEVSGNKIWWKLRNEQAFAWSGATNFIPTLPVNTTPPVSQPTVSTPPIIQTPPTENVEQLKLQIDALQGELKRVNITLGEVNKNNDDVKEELRKANAELAKFGDLNFETVKNANESLSIQNAELLRKNKDLANQRDDAYVKAFAGWYLKEVPEGASGIATVLSLIARLLKFSSKKHYVVGWKEGASLHRVDGETPPVAAESATAADLNPVA